MSVQEVARWAVVCDGCGSRLSAAAESKRAAERLRTAMRAEGGDTDPEDLCVYCWEARQ